METIYIITEEVKPLKKVKRNLRKNWFKNWTPKKRVEELCVCRPSYTKELVDVEYDYWNDETTYTFKYNF